MAGATKTRRNEILTDSLQTPDARVGFDQRGDVRRSVEGVVVRNVERAVRSLWLRSRARVEHVVAHLPRTRLGTFEPADRIFGAEEVVALHLHDGAHAAVHARAIGVVAVVVVEQMGPAEA